MTVGEIEEKMTVEEFVEWSVHFTLQQEEAEKAKRAAGNGKHQNPIRHNRKG